MHPVRWTEETGSMWLWAFQVSNSSEPPRSTVMLKRSTWKRTRKKPTLLKTLVSGQLLWLNTGGRSQIWNLGKLNGPHCDIRQTISNLSGILEVQEESLVGVIDPNRSREGHWFMTETLCHENIVDHLCIWTGNTVIAEEVPGWHGPKMSKEHVLIFRQGRIPIPTFRPTMIKPCRYALESRDLAVLRRVVISSGRPFGPRL